MVKRPLLDRRVRFDDRSRAFSVRPFVEGIPRRKQLWTIPDPLPLNQGTEGACVGFGWSAELAVDPIAYRVTDQFARTIYEGAREIDRQAGYNFPEGATVLAGAKFAKQQGWIREYRWAFGINDVIDTLVSKGPVVLGVNWYDGMYATEPDGRVRINGPLVGGHCILATGYYPAHPVWGGNWIQWVNSWGPSYGVRGVGYIRDTDLDRLLREDGEACVAMDIAPTNRVPWWQKAIRALGSPFRMD